MYVGEKRGGKEARKKQPPTNSRCNTITLAAGNLAEPAVTDHQAFPDTSYVVR